MKQFVKLFWPQRQPKKSLFLENVKLSPKSCRAIGWKIIKHEIGINTGRENGVKTTFLSLEFST